MVWYYFSHDNFNGTVRALVIALIRQKNAGYNPDYIGTLDCEAVIVFLSVKDKSCCSPETGGMVALQTDGFLENE